MLKINEEFIKKLTARAKALGYDMTPKMQKALDDIRHNKQTKRAMDLLKILEANEQVLKDNLGSW